MGLTRSTPQLLCNSSPNRGAILKEILQSLHSIRMTKLSFVIGEFISGWSHEAWMKIMPCGSL